VHASILLFRLVVDAKHALPVAVGASERHPTPRVVWDWTRSLSPTPSIAAADLARTRAPLT